MATNASSAERKTTAAMKDTKDVADAAASEVGARIDGTVRKVREQASELEEVVVREASELAASVNDRLKSVGVDTDVMVGAAKEHATELQRLIAEELQARPFRTLGIAAGIGLLVGFLSAR